MNVTEQILLITLAAFLALFLILAVFLTIQLIRLVKSMNVVAEKAREVMGNVESASEMFKKTAGPLAVGRFFVNMADVVMKHKKRG